MEENKLDINCGICKVIVEEDSISLFCDVCKDLFHNNCNETPLNYELYALLNDAPNNIKWFCDKCVYETEKYIISRERINKLKGKQKDKANEETKEEGYCEDKAVIHEEGSLYSEEETYEDNAVMDDHDGNEEYNKDDTFAIVDTDMKIKIVANMKNKGLNKEGRYKDNAMLNTKAPDSFNFISIKQKQKHAPTGLFIPTSQTTNHATMSSDNKFACSECKKCFTSQSTLNRHVREIHKAKFDSPCPLCQEVFKTERYLKDHIKGNHHSSSEGFPNKKFDSLNYKQNKNFKCHEEGCVDINLLTTKDFRKHLKEIHGKEMKQSTYLFLSNEEFSHWKDNLEAKIGIKYSTRKGMRDNKITFYCRRSGIYKPRGKNKKRLKKQGTCKIGSHCSSTIELCITGGLYNVTHFEDHFGHTLTKEDLCHTLLPRSTRQFIADKLNQKVPVKDILEMVKNNSSEAERSRLIKRQDIVNIKKKSKVVL